MKTPSIAVIMGSTRPQRLAPAIAQWVTEIGRGIVAAQFELIDLRDWPLPMDDEPGIPALGIYAHPHTSAWSRKIAGSDAFVFVTPQYNWGYPAPLKNALDHLHREWSGKPALVVTYGGHGGGKCAEQLRQVLTGLKVRTVETMPELTLPRDQIEANTGIIDAAEQFAPYAATIEQAFRELSVALGSS